MEALSNVRDSFLEDIIDVAPIAIIALDKRLRISLINSRGRQYIGPTALGLDYIGQPIIDVLNKFGRCVQPLNKNLSEFHFHFDLKDIKLGARQLNIRCRPFKDGAILTLYKIISYKEKETATYNAIFEGQEQERKRFAQEIHDGVGPLLSTLKFGIENLQTASDTTEIAVIRQEASHLNEIVGLISSDIRSISHSLLPSSLVDYGLESSLRNLCDIVHNQRKLKLSSYFSENFPRLQPASELGLYRIAQELLNNAIKHSFANNLAVQLVRHPNSIVLMIEDDGVGLDLNHFNNQLQGIGFKNIKTRVETLNGTFSIESALGKGFLAIIELPLDLQEKT